MANRQHLQWLLEGIDSWNRRRSVETFLPDLSGVNIYVECVKSGRLDNSGHVSFPRINLDQANLRNSDLSGFPFADGIDFDKASFRSADLSNANLAYSKLEGADFRYAKLNRTLMLGAKLCGADMTQSRLTETDLSKTNLTNVNFEHAHFKDALMREACLRGANLLTANLVGTDLVGSEPWQAKLYPESMSYPTYGESWISTDAIQCLEDLLEACRIVKSHLHDAILFFRGEAAIGWDLRPSVMRHSKEGMSTFRANEGKMLLDLMARRPMDFQGTRSAFAQWVIAQHHGLKTRLLDITRNPLVALFWGCLDTNASQPGILHIFSLPKEIIKPFNSDTVSVIANFAKLPWEDQNILLGRTMNDINDKGLSADFQINYKYSLDRLYQLIRKEKPYFEERIDPKDFYRVFVVEPEQSFERIQAQSGAFLISAFHERFERNEVLDSTLGVPIYGHHIWEIPTGDKDSILDVLASVNITRETLLPSLDESAKAIIDTYST